MSVSAPQSVPTVLVFDYYLKGVGTASGNTAAIANAPVVVELNVANANSITPQTTLTAAKVTTTTDANGWWGVYLVPNTNINPANTLYTVTVDGQITYEITVGSVGPYQSTAVGTIVNTPLPLASPTSSTTGDPWYDVKGFGAKGDGTTDDTAAINTAITTANTAGGGTVFIPPGTYHIVGTIIGANKVQIRGAGMNTTFLVFDDAVGTGSAAIYFNNTAATSVALSAAAYTAGSFTVTVVAGGGVNFVAGAFIYLTDGVANNGRFITKVQSVATDTITLEEACPFSLANGAGGGLAYYFSTAGSFTGMWQGCGVQDLSLRCSVNPPVTRQFGVYFQQCADAIARNVRSQSFREGGFQAATSKNLIFEDCVAEDCQNSGGTSGSGFNTNTCTGTIFRNNKIYHCAFGLATTFESYARVEGNSVGARITNPPGGRAIILLDGAYSQVVDNSIYDFPLFAVYVEDSFGCVISDNSIFNTGFNTSQTGIQVGGLTATLSHHNVIADNVIKGLGGVGIGLNPTGGAATEMFNSITGNIISAPSFTAISVGSSSNLIANNLCEGYANAGILTAASTTRNTITGNKLRSGAGNAIQTIDSIGGNFVSNNDVGGQATSLHALDGPVVGTSGVLINTITPTAGSTVDYTSIPSWYRTLEIRYVSRDNGAGTSLSFLTMKLNNDGGANYWDEQGNFNDASVAASEALTQTVGARCGISINGGAAAGEAAYGSIWLPFYANTTYNKSGTWDVTAKWADATTNTRRYAGTWAWKSTAAINRITITGPFDGTSVFEFIGHP